MKPIQEWMDSLKPCPFCRNTRLDVFETDNSMRFYSDDEYECEVMCDCGASMVGDMCKTEEKAIISAIRKWNKRKN